jgi:diacylglycerol kinase family enzyme
MHGWLLA